MAYTPETYTVEIGIVGPNRTLDVQPLINTELLEGLIKESLPPINAVHLKKKDVIYKTLDNGRSVTSAKVLTFPLAPALEDKGIPRTHPADEVMIGVATHVAEALRKIKTGAIICLDLAPKTLNEDGTALISSEHMYPPYVAPVEVTKPTDAYDVADIASVQTN